MKKTNILRLALFIIFDTLAVIVSGLISANLVFAPFLYEYKFFVIYLLINSLMVITLFILFKLYEQEYDCFSFYEQIFRLIISCLIMFITNLIASIFIKKISFRFIITNTIFIFVLTGLIRFVHKYTKLKRTNSFNFKYSSIKKDININDLLGGREQLKLNFDEITHYIENQIVLITGGGGSIGSELCRQIALSNPKQLIIVDIYENGAYDIEQELKMKYPNLNLLVLIASIRDEGKINDIFSKYKPTIVFNAAAHKHVPLMEKSPNEAIKNNVFGTLNVAKACDKYGVKKMVQISTDKAVNPTNIMGASKRICEMIIQTIGRKSKTCDFVAVRFGNVLESNGSVIPLFKKQIAAGGPVTVTHKDIVRYFMTIPEAVSLVLQAGAYAKGGQIYVLDMGKPVRIYDLACHLIKLSGLTPNVDIEIKITGLRDGEKLFEERFMEKEELERTKNNLISIAKPLDIDEEILFSMLDKLYKKAYEETDDIKQLVSELVPTYKYK